MILTLLFRLRHDRQLSEFLSAMYMPLENGTVRLQIRVFRLVSASYFRGSDVQPS